MDESLWKFLVKFLMNPRRVFWLPKMYLWKKFKGNPCKITWIFFRIVYESLRDILKEALEEFLVESQKNFLIEFLEKVSELISR